MLAEFNSQEAENSAFEEAMKTANSWEGKLNELSNTWTDFVNGIVNSDTAKTVIDWINSIIKGIDSIRDGIGTIPTILGSIATVNAFKNVGVFSSDIRNGFIQYGQTLKSLKLFTGDLNTQTELLALTVQNLTPRQQALALATNGVNQAQIAEVLSLNQVEKSQVQQILLDTAIIQKKKELTMATAQEAIMAQGLNKATALSIMQSAGIIAGDDAEVISKKQVSVATLEAKLAQEGLSATQIKAITTQLGLSASTVTLSNYFKGLAASALSAAKAVTTFLLTNPIGWAILAGTAIIGVTAGISNYNKKQEELRQKSLESAKSTKELTDSMDDLISQYESIVDSEKSEAEKTEELTEWKQTLAETYGITKDKLANLNLEREDGIKLLEEEIRLAKIRQQIDWQDKNEDTVNKSRQQLDRVSRFNSNGYSYMDGTDVWTQQSSSISNDIKALFDRVERTNGGLDIQLKIDTDNAIDELERLHSISNEITNISLTRTLTSSEQQLLDDIKSQIAYLETFQSDIDVVKQSISSKAFVKFETYKINDDSYKNLGKDSYISWRDGLLKTADGDKLLEKELLVLAEQQFPDYAKYFENLNKAEIKFGVNQSNDSFNALKKSLLGQLSNEQLEIAIQIPDLFTNGSFDGTLKSITDRIDTWNKSNGNTLEVKFNYSEYSEQVDNVIKNIDTLQSALDNLNSGKSLEAKDITELANTFPDYSTKILSAANSTEELKLVLTDIKRNAPKSLINTLENLSGLSKQDQDAVNGLISVLTTVNDKTSTYADTLADLETKESLLSSVYKEMHDDGQISISTYQKLIEMGDDYANMVTVINGKITVNAQDLKELTKKKYEDEIATLKLTKAELGYNIASNPQNYSLYAEKINAINDDIEAKEKALELLNGFDYTKDTKESKDDPWKDEAEAEIAKIQHMEAMLQITHEQYIDELDKINQKYFANNEKYLTEFNKYDEEVFKGRRELAEKAFDDTIDGIEKEIDALEKLKDEASIDADKIIDPKATEELKKFNEEMQKTFGLGNVDLTKRPKVSAEAMRKAGYDAEDGETATVYSSTEFIWQGDDKNGKYVAVHYTPILPDGTVLDDESLRKYLYETLESSQDILDTDKNNLGIVLKVDTDFNISDKDIQSLGTDKPTQNIQDIIKACDDWDVALHEVQEQWMELDNKVASSNTTNGDNIYEIIDKQIGLYNKAIAEIDKRIAELEASGLVGIEDEIKELNKQRDDLLEKVYDLGKERTSTGIENEISYWEEMQSKQNEFYDKQIEKLKKQKELLEDKNDEEERAKDLAEKQLDLRKAEIALDEARRNRSVLTISEGGAFSYEVDQTAIAEAEQDVKKAEDDLAKTEKDILKDGIDKQIDILEEQKDNDDEYYDTIIKLLEDMSGKNKVQSESNRDIWGQLLATDAGQNALANIDPDKLQELLDSGFLVKKDGKYSLGEKKPNEVFKAGTDVIKILSNLLHKPESEIKANEKLMKAVSGGSGIWNSLTMPSQSALSELTKTKNTAVTNYNNSKISNNYRVDKIEIGYSGDDFNGMLEQAFNAMNQGITINGNKVAYGN